ILVAWNDCRECARATFDALPLLAKADNVVVARVAEHSRQAGDGEARTTFGGDLAAALARHGVKCEVTTLALTGGSIAGTLFAAA
ncbi:hypothetical protein ABTM61_19925, partial [Acinetobacter baumannii]